MNSKTHCPHIAHFADHAIEDLIEKVACQFTAQHIRGRPRPPYWYPGFPLYVCDSEYNDRERVFVKVTNWNGCVPEEVRQGEGGEEGLMSIFPFEKIVWPKKVGSPFLVGRGGVKGPGGIVNVPAGNGANQAGSGGDSDDVTKKTRVDGNPSRAQQLPPPLPSATTTTMVAQTSAHAVQPNPYQLFQQPYVQQQPVPQSQRLTMSSDRSIVAAAGGVAAIGGPAQVEKLPPETGRFFIPASISFFSSFIDDL